ncbi:MAG: hypothetical protein PHI23_01440 [Candidatus Peribacteraceae bacterium]|nr:hypothetical protein [Candidatus Peribacteraceae bacterium]
MISILVPSSSSKCSTAQLSPTSWRRGARPPSSIPSVFSLIGQSWEFLRKQPALGSVLLWLIILPMAVLAAFTTLLTPREERLMTSFLGIVPLSAPVNFLFLVLQIVLVLIVTWGIACVILVGKRLIASRAGRARTSFRTVRSKGATYIVPLFLTSILRDCFAFFWAILFVIPGIVYSLRTAFYPVIIIAEGRSYRAALRRSRQVAMGRTWTVLRKLLGLALLLFVPPTLLLLPLRELAASADLPLLILLDVLEAGLNGLATVLFTLSLVLLYGEFLRSSNI